MKDRGIGSYLRTLDTREDLEDWFLSKNLEFIKKRRKARQDKNTFWEKVRVG
jgi:hypothetical protein